MKTRLAAKNAKGNRRRQKWSKENGIEIIENSISGDVVWNRNNWRVLDYVAKKMK